MSAAFPIATSRMVETTPIIPARSGRHVHAIFRFAPWWWWKAQPFNPLHGDTTVIILGILVSIAAIGTMCWLLFNLAVFALPFFIGLTAGTWAYGTGAGWLGAILVGLVAAGVTLAVGQGLLILVRPIWARMLIALAFVAPASVAGFYATLGIVKHMMPSETWQLIFSVIGAVAVGVTAFMRVAGMAATGPADGNLARM